MTFETRLTDGSPWPLGATVSGDGVNFAVFSEHALRMSVCLFSPDGKNEIARHDFAERTNHVWHGHISGIVEGQLYGFRAHGLYDPANGFRFNANKLLVDPYARQLQGELAWNDALFGFIPGRPEADIGFDTRDSAPFMPKCVVCKDPVSFDHSNRPKTNLRDTIIYEAHVKGLTATHPNVPSPGTFAALASDPMINHLKSMGITAIELLPVHAFLNDRFLVERNLVNYWGYQTLCFLAPEPRYLNGASILEFRHMVERFHQNDIEVFLDVVYNHTCEGNELGPTLSFRGLDNASYYRLQKNRRYYIDDTGTGNTLNVSHPFVMRLIMDSLRYWVEVMGVDGFRFDLCSVLGRTGNGFDPNAPIFQAIRQDPVLSRVKLIAEPWDIGPGGYQLGAYPPPFLEWNDKFRDTVRRFWRGDQGMVPDLANRLAGSAQQFDHSGRGASSSVNFITAHDGFTLTDMVSYENKHNEANGEKNRDGHHANYSDNMGVEGPTEDGEIIAARARRRRNMMATLLLSQGTPMLLAGDELGNTQNGNNNAYCQDNAIAWIDWEGIDQTFLDFTRKLIGFRKAHPILRQSLFLHSRERLIDGIEDLFWWRADGEEMQHGDWLDPENRFLAAEIRTASGTPRHAALEYALLLVFNAGMECSMKLPPCPNGDDWVCQIDTSNPEAEPRRCTESHWQVPFDAVLAFTQDVS